LSLCRFQDTPGIADEEETMRGHDDRCKDVEDGTAKMRNEVIYFEKEKKVR